VTEPAEAAHVPSRFRTEPMRCRLPITSSLRSRFRGECSRRKHVILRESSLPFCLACTWHGEVSGALRLQIPLEGVRRQGRRCMGTCSGLTPYSCLVPPRCFHLVMKMPQSGRRCLNHPGAEDRRLLSVRNKTEANDYDVKKLQNGRPWKERTYILRGQITVSGRAASMIPRPWHTGHFIRRHTTLPRVFSFSSTLPRPLQREQSGAKSRGSSALA
jgi:hypothetical protein